MAFNVEFANQYLPTQTRLTRAEGTEAVNLLWRWDLHLISPTALDVTSMLRTPGELVLIDEEEQFERTILGIIRSVALIDVDGNGFEYRLELRSEESLLELCAGYDVLLEQTVPEMVERVFEREGLGAARLRMRLEGTYAPRPYTVQYGESHWAFLERLLADEGISYWFDLADGAPLLILADSKSVLDPISGRVQLTFQESRGGMPVRRIRHLEQRLRIGHTGTHLLDYDPRNPDVPIDGTEGTPEAEHFEYPASILRELASDRARVRLQQLNTDKLRDIAWTDCMRLQPGRRFEVTDCAIDEYNGERFIVSVRHHWARRGEAGGSDTAYHNEIELAAALEPLRPGLPLRRHVSGIEIGITTGEGGEEIYVDDHANVRLRFPWDRSGRSDHTSSYWARTVQMALGGSMVLPRTGWEVPVMYRDGDPNYPIVLGRLYNPDTAVPYGLPDKKATSSFQSATSPYDGTNNELRMSDDAGMQEMYVHASRDQTVNVGGSSTLDVTLNETHDVGLSYGLCVDASQVMTVGAQRTATIGTDHTQKISGARSETIGAIDHTKVSGNRFISASGSYAELVGGIYGIQCNQLNTDVGGAYLQVVGAAATHVAGLGISLTVAGANALAVGGAETISLRAAFSEKTKGPKNASIGAVKVVSGDKMGVTHDGTASVKVGGTANVKASGKLSITAPKIQVNISGTLNASGLKLSGGTFNVTKGTSKLDGNIKRKGGSKIE